MTTPASLQNLLDQMQRNNDVMNGWDVVVNLLVEPVNALFEIVYRDEPQGTWRAVDVCYCQVVPNPSGDGRLAVYTDLKVTLADPQLVFGPGNEAVAQITFGATGTLKQASKAVGDDFQPPADCPPDDGSLNWKSTPLDAEQFVATVPLTVLTGRTASDSDGFRVILNFPSGSFRFPSLQDAPDPDQLSTEVQGYFAANDVEYVINEVDTKVINQLPVLTPTSFKLNTLTTNTGKNVLQYFVTTTGSEPTNLTVNVNEPVPDGSQGTIMIAQSIASQLGSDEIQQVSLFAIENLVFPGTSALVLKDHYTPKDLLVLTDFDLGDTLQVVSGNGQSVVRSGDSPTGGTALFGPLQVKALDVLGKPSPGTTVTFAPGTHPPRMVVQLVPSGGSQATAVTNSDGIATLDQMPGGKSASCYYAEGAFQIVATAPGGKTTTFDMTVAPTPPPPDLPGAKVTVVSGDAQSVARSGQCVPGGIATFAPLSVVVKDKNGNLIPNAEVEWAAGSHPSAMAVQLTPSGAGNPTTVTDDQGVATLALIGGKSVNCYYAEGAFQVVASVRKGGSATFNLTVAPTPPPPDLQGAKVTVVSGDGQSVARSGQSPPGGIASFAPLSVVVKDKDGNVVPHALVSWAPGNHPNAMAVQLDPSGASGKTTTADAQGVATLNSMPGGKSASCYYAEGGFQVVASVRKGGSATFNLTVAPTPPPPVHPDAHLVIVSGNGQSAARQGSDVPGGQAMFGPMQVQVLDPQNRAMPGVQVSWTPHGRGSMAVQVTPSGGTPAVVTSDSNGMAILNLMPGGYSVYCYYATGGFTVTASVNGGGSATFNGTVKG